MSSIADIGGAFVQNNHEPRDYEAKIRAGQFSAMKGMFRSPEDDLRRAAIQAVIISTGTARSLSSSEGLA